MLLLQLQNRCAHARELDELGRMSCVPAAGTSIPLWVKECGCKGSECCVRMGG
jgi:hypothetical protein